MQTDIKNLSINKQPINRFLTGKGTNVNGWYEIYNDGYKRVGKIWSAQNPLKVQNPRWGEVVTLPISFSHTIQSVHVSVESTTDNIETINYVLYSHSAIRLCGAIVGADGIKPIDTMQCTYILEGY